ncbi:MAG: oligosaccharide flippase family protein [Candidatus Aenigmatarchaeota archaeon]
MLFQALILTASVFFGMFINYVFNFFMARSLSPSLYGELAIIIALYNDLFVVGGSLQTLAAREIARIKEKKACYVVKKLGLISLFIGLAFAFLVFILSFFTERISENLRVPLQIISFGLPFGFILSIAKAYLQGKEKVIKYALISSLEPLVKLFFGIALVSFGLSLVGASLSLVLPSVVFLIFFFPLFFKKSERYDIKINKEFFFLTITSFLLMLYFYLDLYFVRFYLGAEEAGYYNVASITSKVLMYASGGLATIVLPRYSRNTKQKIKPVIINNFIIVMPIFALFLLFPSFIITILYSEKYLMAKDAFVILCVAMFLQSFFRILLTVLWSRKKDWLALKLVIFGLILNFIFLFFMTKYGILYVALATLLSSFIITVSSFFYIRK